MATSRDVAKLAGVSISTVSRAFRENSYISDELRSKVFAAAEQLGYTPNLMARNLRQNKSGIIGIIIPYMDNAFYMIITQIIESYLKQIGYRLLICYGNGTLNQEISNINLLLSSRVEGIIFTPVPAKNRSLINKLKKQNIALVQMYWAPYSDIDSVVSNDRKGAYLATKHLLTNGHSNILLLSYEIHDQGRSTGYKQALAEKNIPINESNIAYLPLQQNLREMVAKKMMETKPTAIVAATNLLGMDVIKVCKDYNLSIPEDISLIMFDEVSWPSLLDITTIAQSVEDIGFSAYQTLMDRIDKEKNNQSPITISLEPSLISRNSVKNLYNKY